MDCVHWQCFLEVFLSPCCYFHYSSIPVCDAVPSKGPKITGIQYGFPALTLTHRDCSRFSESLDDIMHCRWWSLQTLCNFSLRNSFSDIAPLFFAAALGELVILFPSWLLRHCHSERLFLYPIMLPIDLISCKLVLQLFLICTFNFSGLLLLPVPTFLECVALMKSKMSQYLAWHFKMSHFQHLICYLYSIVNKI